MAHYTPEMNELIDKARDSNSTAEELDEIVAAHTTPLAVKNLVTENPNANPETLRSLLNVDDANILFNLAVNPNTPADIIADIVSGKISHSANIMLQVIGLWHHTTPETVLDNFCDIENYNILSAVIRNPNCSQKIFNRVHAKMVDVNVGLKSYQRKELIRSAVEHELVTTEQLLSYLTVCSTGILNDGEPFYAQKLVTLLRNQGYFLDFPDEWVEAQYGVCV